MLQDNLNKILKAESGKDEGDTDKSTANTMALEGVAKLLKEKTGRNEFTMEELMNPDRTIKKYKKV